MRRGVGDSGIIAGLFRSRPDHHFPFSSDRFGCGGVAIIRWPSDKVSSPR